MKTEIFVMTHKKCTIPDIPGYQRLQVGSALHEDLGYMRDDMGEDHISDLNPYYAELTGVYWLWKNYFDADIIGVCHYRRYFINDNNMIMTMQEYEEKLKDSDVIAALADNDVGSLELFSKAHHKEDMLAVGRAILKLYPEDYKAFTDMLNTKRCTLGNLCVMRRSLFGEYCEWLFNVLAEAGEEIHAQEYDDYHKKVFGILAEGLLWTFVKAKGLCLCECRAAFSDEKIETKELRVVLQKLLSDGRKDEAANLLQRSLLERPDLISLESDLTGELREIFRILKI